MAHSDANPCEGKRPCLPSYEESLSSSRKLFSMFDVNRDGCITTDDVRVLMKSLQIYPNTFDLKRVIAEVDCDQDGVVSMKEFIDMRRSNLSHELNILATFKKFDMDKIHRGFLTERTIRQVLSDEGLQQSQVDEIARYLMSCDHDKDGRISYRDLHDLIMGNLPDTWEVWVRKNLSKGVSKDQLRTIMLSQGLSALAVDKTLDAFGSPRKNDDDSSFARNSFTRPYVVRS
eukprot:TRINITY_DN9191_c0_g1_i1.p1 TRINITY_DN9191_c0_g1~~TRINITY_DN9191_c0_g1_i1.p1  ORF type:complete len:231 (-),score=34.31 TRINITY_DN9191_c0_g1_i1:226-918(-)